MNNGNTKEGTNVEVNAANDAISQQFVFEKVEPVKGEQSIEDGIYTIKSAKDTNMVLDIGGGSLENGANLQIWWNTKVDQQHYEVEYLGNGDYSISPIHSGKVLDVASGGMTSGTNIWQYTWNGTDAQKWIIKDTGDGTFNIISKLNELYLDLNNGNTKEGTNVEVNTSNGAISQKFILEKNEFITGQETISSGNYRIRVSSDMNKTLDIEGKSIENGANVHIWDYAGNSNQEFEIKYLNNGFYEIVSSVSGKALDGGISLSDENVYQFQNDGTYSQQWYIKDLGDGTFNIISRLSGLYLQLEESTASNGTNITVGNENESEQQKFVFDKIEETCPQTIKNGMYEIQIVSNPQKVFDVGGGSLENGANIQLWGDANVAQQKFFVTYLDEGYYTIRAVHSEKYLSIEGKTYSIDSNIDQFVENSLDATQEWLIKDLGNETYNIVSKYNGLYIDIDTDIPSDGSNIQLNIKDNSQNQAFKFIETSYSNVKEGVYQIMLAELDYKSLDLAGGSLENKANIQVWDGVDVNQQKFELIYDSKKDTYKIQVIKSRKNLQIEPNTNVEQYEETDELIQEWKIIDNGDGTYHIVSVSNGKYLTIDGYENGQNVYVGDKNGDDTQLFKLIETTIVDEKITNYRNIDQNKYPGMKEELDKLQQKYPNWEINIMNTGLDWNTVIAAQDQVINGVPKSLIHQNYGSAWRNGDEKYDVSGKWYRASVSAIEYMVETRNSLDPAWIFQFQDLSSSSGTREEINKMTKGTFLEGESITNAIMQAANQYSVSPFHIISRIIQEQGSDGSGVMNGYEYNVNGEIIKVYNLFNINVSGNDYEQGCLNGAEYAYQRGWFSIEESILGGTEFLRTNYLNAGQTTLYFQKFDIIETNGYYSNQYMQNIRGANDEGNIIYNEYKEAGILDSSFEFIIPLYENMPINPAPRP